MANEAFEVRAKTILDQAAVGGPISELRKVVEESLNWATRQAQAQMSCGHPKACRQTCGPTDVDPMERTMPVVNVCSACERERLAVKQAQEPMACGHPKACLETHVKSFCPSHDYSDPGYPPIECAFCDTETRCSACEHERLAVEQAKESIITTFEQRIKVLETQTEHAKLKATQNAASRDTEWAIAFMVATDGLPSESTLIAFDQGDLTAATKKIVADIQEQAVSVTVERCAEYVKLHQLTQGPHLLVHCIRALSPDPHYVERKVLEAQLDEQMKSQCHNRVEFLKSQLADLDKPEGGKR